MHVIVLGAGLLGVTSAWFLRQQGHEVTVVDRQASAAAETSFANGGMARGHDTITCRRKAKFGLMRKRRNVTKNVPTAL